MLISGKGECKGRDVFRDKESLHNDKVASISKRHNNLSYAYANNRVSKYVRQKLVNYKGKWMTPLLYLEMSITLYQKWIDNSRQKTSKDMVN